MKSNQKYKEFQVDENAAIGMIITGALILILSIIIVPVFFRVAASTNSDSIDTALRTNVYGMSSGGTGDNSSDAANASWAASNASWAAWNNTNPAGNATGTIIDIGSSVLNLNPLAALVAVAGGIIGILLAVLSPRMFAGAGL